MTGHGCRCVEGENDKGGRLVNLWAFSEENENNTTCDVGFPGEWSRPRQFDMQTILDECGLLQLAEVIFYKGINYLSIPSPRWTLA